MPPVAIGLAAIGAAVGGAGIGVGIGAAVLGASVIATGIGTVMSVVGAITHNKLVSQIGMGFGVAGAVGGLGAAGAVGGVFGESVAASSLAPLESSVAETALTSNVGASVLGQETGQVAKLGGGSTTAGTVGGQENVAQVAPRAGGLIETPPPSLTAPTSLTSTATPGSLSNLTVPGATTDFSAAGMNLGKTLDTIKNIPTSGLGQFFSTMEPTAKAALVMAGGQAVAGGVGGIFSGMSADKQLALQQLIDQENRSQFDRQMTRATSSPGLIQFAKPQTPLAPSVLNPSAPIAPTT